MDFLEGRYHNYQVWEVLSSEGAEISQNPPKRACIDHAVFPLFLKVWRHRYALFYENKVFFLLSYSTKTSVLQLFNLLFVVVLQQSSQKLFY